MSADWAIDLSGYMRTFSRAEVLEAVTGAFEPSQQAEVLRELARYGVEPHEHQREQVQIAIVNLSERKFDRLVHFVDAAKKDYRDVLYWTEFTS